MSFDQHQPAYKALRDIIAERTHSIVGWVGSGMSVPAGLPTWAELKRSLIEDYKGKINTLSGDDKKQEEAVIEVVERKNNLWTCFEILKDNMGTETYRQTIRDELSVANSVEPPSNYNKLWNLGISGLINLNIDRLATRSYIQTRSLEPLEYTGQNIENCMGALANPNPFILNIHGEVDNFASWVFTKDAINWMMNKEEYQRFIENILVNRTVLFVGLSVDDISVGSHLRRVSDNYDIGGHFWITNRQDKETDKWAEDMGLRIIRYSTPDGDHSALNQLFDDLTSYVPEEEEAPPVEPDVEVNERDEDLPNPSDLARKKPETIRRVLNDEAKRILQSDNPRRYNQYAEFCDTYDRAVYNAWYTTTSRPDNTLMEYDLLEEVASGAFGQVYRATDEDGNVYAIKKLKEDIRKKQKMLQGFRRGVRSHKILTRRDVNGIIDYYSASEIPTFVAMEWINGPTLKEAIDSRYLTEWGELLKVMSDLSHIIREAHSLPERVLHRDIRPPNVMLKGYFQDPQEYEIVVLDFDLSWHKGSIEETIKEGHSYVGYLAPEQTSKNPKHSTRSAAVDSYGIGMTMYYLLARDNPDANQHKYTDWKGRLLELAQSRSCSTWKSAPKRFARLIYNCTRHEQPARWDMTQIYNEINRIRDAVIGKAPQIHSELVAEEIAQRCGDYPYNWNSQEMRAEIELPSGVDIYISPKEEESKVAVRIRWSSTGKENRKNVGKYIKNNVMSISSNLRSANWVVMDESVESRSFVIRAFKNTESILHNLESDVRTLRESIRDVEFV